MDRWILYDMLKFKKTKKKVIKSDANEHTLIQDIDIASKWVVHLVTM